MTQRSRPEDEVLHEIRTRWRAVDLANAWVGLPPERRARVIGEVEASVWSVRYSEPVFASDLNIALEAIAAALPVLGAQAASADVGTLLTMIERLKSE